VIELELLKTGLMLGALVLLAGCYGIFYGIGRLADWRTMRFAGFACYGLQCVIALTVVGYSPLTNPWKLVVVVGTVGFLGIPPFTWRLVEHTHATEEHV
jgi:peptidoglycan/LPS O-acetylase OafA/YrhL